MQGKIHVGKNGPGPCEAQISCRLQHFDTMEEATASYKEAMAAEFDIYKGSTRKKKAGPSFSSKMAKLLSNPKKVKIAATVTALALVLGGAAAYTSATDNVQTCTVTSKSVEVVTKTHSDGVQTGTEKKLIVDTAECGFFELGNKLGDINIMNANTLYKEIQEGQTYSISSYGFNSPFTTQVAYNASAIS